MLFKTESGSRCLDLFLAGVSNSEDLGSLSDAASGRSVDGFVSFLTFLSFAFFSIFGSQQASTSVNKGVCVEVRKMSTMKKNLNSSTNRQQASTKGSV